MQVIIIRRAKVASTPSQLQTRLGSLLGDKNITELNMSHTKGLSLREHTLRLRRQWLKLGHTGSPAHIIASSHECEVLKFWLTHHPGDFSSATLINPWSLSAPSIIQVFSRMRSYIKDLFYYWRFCFGVISSRVSLSGLEYLVLESSHIQVLKNTEESVDIIKHPESSEHIQEDDPEWVANQIYTWINRDENS